MYVRQLPEETYKDINIDMLFEKLQMLSKLCSQLISQLPKLCVKISILRHRCMRVHSFSTRLTFVTFAEDKMLICLILRKNAKIVQL